MAEDDLGLHVKYWYETLRLQRFSKKTILKGIFFLSTFEEKRNPRDFDRSLTSLGLNQEEGRKPLTLLIHPKNILFRGVYVILSTNEVLDGIFPTFDFIEERFR